jgi:hypothetical protein
MREFLPGPAPESISRCLSQPRGAIEIARELPDEPSMIANAAPPAAQHPALAILLKRRCFRQTLEKEMAGLVFGEVSCPIHSQ